MRAVLALAAAAVLASGCFSLPQGTGVRRLSFASSPDHLWLSGQFDGKSRYDVHNWTPDEGRWRIEWRGHLERGEVHVTLWDAGHDVVLERAFTPLSDPVFAQDIEVARPGAWQLGVLWGDVVGDVSLEAWRLPGPADP